MLTAQKGGWDACPSKSVSARAIERFVLERRIFIRKPYGRRRPLGIATLEDKIVQQAVVTVLSTIWEEDFLGLSYGFRPGRGPHDALDALARGLTRRKVNWVLGADIQGLQGRSVPRPEETAAFPSRRDPGKSAAASQDPSTNRVTRSFTARKHSRILTGTWSCTSQEARSLSVSGEGGYASAAKERDGGQDAGAEQHD
jgi:hypothetical protein